MVPNDPFAIISNVELDDTIYKKHTAHCPIRCGKRWSRDEHWSGCTLKRPDTHHGQLAKQLLPINISILLDVEAIGRWAKPASALLLGLAPEFGHFVKDQPIQPVGLPSHMYAL